MKQRVVKQEEELLRKSNLAEMYKTSIMTALDEQKVANLKAIIATKKEHEELDRAQVDYTISKDEAWKRRE